MKLEPVLALTMVALGLWLFALFICACMWANLVIEQVAAR